MKAFQTILSFLLVTLVLISSIGHSVSFHLCGGEIENVALFGHAKACSMQDDSCVRNVKGNHKSQHTKGCCEEKTVVLDTDLCLSKITEKVTAGNFLDLSIPVHYHILESHIFSAIERNHRRLYKPPLIDQEIIVLVQTFLI